MVTVSKVKFCHHSISLASSVTLTFMSVVQVMSGSCSHNDYGAMMIMEITLKVIYIVAVKASPPGFPNIDRVGKNFVDLSWTKPRSDGGSPIKGIRILFHWLSQVSRMDYLNKLAAVLS